MKGWARIILAGVLALTPTLGLYGCGGGNARLEHKSTATTLGRELMDLDEARRKGVITESEYNDLRKDVIEKHRQ
ncbi:MAG: hypothetical protein LDL11_06350 [Desulfarculus sp.]|nr:hypothetical protein [Desulfarculus sp.]